MPIGRRNVYMAYISKPIFRNLHGIYLKTYFRNLNVQFICLETKMTPKTKFRMLNMQFASSETRMRLEANFREPNLHLTSSHRDKFEDSW